MSERHPGRLVQRVDGVDGLAGPAYGGHDRQRGLGQVGTDAYDAQRVLSVVSTGSTDARGSTRVAFGSLDGSTNR